MFTDIEGSTGLLANVGDAAYSTVLDNHNKLVRDALAAGGGVEVSTEGDSFFAVFVDSLASVITASLIQAQLAAWHPDGVGPLRVRIGLHTGTGVIAADDYVGVDVHRARRISDAGHGGQVVISEVTTNLVEPHLPADLSVRPLGRYRLAGFAEPAPLHELVTAHLEETFPPLRLKPAESMLPRSLSDFVGREVEVDTGLDIIRAHRLLTLTGPGGTGKTRLSMEIARRAEPQFADGAYFVGLAPLKDPGLIPAKLVEALGLETGGGIDPRDHVVRFLAERQVLLVLDNFEHLSEGAHFVSELLSSAPRVTIIATSRAPLRVSGERELPVPPMAVPDPDLNLEVAAGTDGVRLFVSRTEAVQPGFRVEEENLAAITGIVRALDGLPLAIELAASRMRSLTPEVILDRLSNQLLTAQSADLPERQRTMAGTIAWSYDLLEADLQTLFEQLAVFSGTFGLEEAEAVCQGSADTLDGLTALIGQSLLRQSETRRTPRFRMLTVIREFANVALIERGHREEVLSRHAAVYTGLAERADEEILTSQQGPWLARLTDDQDNIRSAFDHAVAVGDDTTALRIAGSMWRFWQIRGRLAEGRSRIETALNMPGDRGQIARARALTGLGGIMYWQGLWNELGPPYEEALQIFREVGSQADVAEALYNLSFALGYAADSSGAEKLQQSLELSQQLGRPLGIGRAYWGIANQRFYRSEWDPALEALQQAADEFSKIDAPYDLGWTWFMFAHVGFKMGEPATVREPLANALRIFARVRDLSALLLILEVLSTLCVVDSDRASGAYFTGAAQRLKAETGAAIVDIELNRYPAMMDFLETMNEMELVSYDEGHSAALEDVIDRAFAVLA